MAPALMEGVSGVRGIVGDGLDGELVRAYALAYAAHCGEGAILVARDPRASGTDLSEAVVGALEGAGRDVVDLGIVPTPTLLLNTSVLSAAGGVMVTASHNPQEWNGLKFADPSGRYLAPQASRMLIAEVRALRACGAVADGGEHPGTGEVRRDGEGGRRHADRTARARGVDTAALRSAGLKVVVDGVNGAASELIPGFLREHGVQVDTIHCDIADGTFPRPAEPLPEALAGLGREVLRRGADAGLGLDPDGDRLALVGPDGVPLGEEATLALAAARVLEVVPSMVVANLSTSRMIEDVARAAGVALVRTPVGEINVVEGMLQADAVVGGEGNGGVIHRDVVLGRDALTAAALVLSAMAAAGIDLPALRSRLPFYAMVKQGWALPNGGPAAVRRAIERAASRLKGARLDNRDGLRADWEDRWVHVRPSNTEPIVRIIAEAPREAEALDLVRRIARLLGLDPVPGEMRGT